MNRKAVAVVFTVSVVMAEASCVRQRSAEGASQLGSIGERRFRDSQPRTPLHRKPGSVPAVTPVVVVVAAVVAGGTGAIESAPIAADPGVLAVVGSGLAPASWAFR